MPENTSNTNEYFYSLTPEGVLRAVEHLGFHCTGRALALNSMENRVYEVEIEVKDESSVQSRYDYFRVVKFYRPGRWSREQILEEHKFLLQLEASDIPVIAPLRDSADETLHQDPESGIWYAVFPKCGGRAPDELSDEQAERIGRLLARLHLVGAREPAPNRLRLSPETYGLDNVRFLREAGFLPNEIAQAYTSTVESICACASPWFAQTASQRIHGDCHAGNILWGNQGPFLLDFDDMVMGPCVQDLWLLLPGRDEEGQRILELMIAGYEQLKAFDRASLRLIEALRALRMVHYSAWIARRWKDPAFTRVFPQFGSPAYWNGQLADLREQLGIVQGTA
ncbi:MAG: serine/threonine protein kinase [Oligoflexia bacterium]|nr:serine/threonine protein kinase [Oligoflexia bacterium]